MKYLYLIICICIFSCSKKEKINVDKDINFEIPSHLKSTKALNQDAFLQFQNLESELYLTVIKEKKDNFIHLLNLDSNSKEVIEKKYVETIISGYKTKFEDFKIINQYKKGKIHIVEFNLKINYLSFYNNLIVFEKDTIYYQMYIWTLDNFKEQNQKTIENIINSIDME